MTWNLDEPLLMLGEPIVIRRMQSPGQSASEWSSLAHAAAMRGIGIAVYSELGGELAIPSRNPPIANWTRNRTRFRFRHPFDLLGQIPVEKLRLYADPKKPFIDKFEALIYTLEIEVGSFPL